MVDFETLKSPTLISHKIKVTEKLVRLVRNFNYKIVLSFRKMILVETVFQFCSFFLGFLAFLGYITKYLPITDYSIWSRVEIPNFDYHINFTEPTTLEFLQLKKLFEKEVCGCLVFDMSKSCGKKLF